MKLTEDDIYWSEEYYHLTILCDLKDYEQLKQQILENQEKAEKLPTALGEAIGYKIKCKELEQEIKQLKEETVKLIDKLIERDYELKELVKSRIELRQKLENIKKIKEQLNGHEIHR